MFIREVRRVLSSYPHPHPQSCTIINEHRVDLLQSKRSSEIENESDEFEICETIEVSIEKGN